MTWFASTTLQISVCSLFCHQHGVVFNIQCYEVNTVKYNNNNNNKWKCFYCSSCALKHTLNLGLVKYDEEMFSLLNVRIMEDTVDWLT